jgi:hypothetical protein
MVFDSLLGEDQFFENDKFNSKAGLLELKNKSLNRFKS